MSQDDTELDDQVRLLSGCQSWQACVALPILTGSVLCSRMTRSWMTR